MTDTERIDWLEKTQGIALVSDDLGYWAVGIALVSDSTSGWQPITDHPPITVSTTFFVEKEEWRPSIREAIDAAIINYA